LESAHCFLPGAADGVALWISYFMEKARSITFRQQGFSIFFDFVGCFAGDGLAAGRFQAI
jgi:hypothetical protein